MVMAIPIEIRMAIVVVALLTAARALPDSLGTTGAHQSVAGLQRVRAILNQARIDGDDMMLTNPLPAFLAFLAFPLAHPVAAVLEKKT
jgi:uncharacterized membrane protein (DUF2068 family)